MLVQLAFAVLLVVGSTAIGPLALSLAGVGSGLSKRRLNEEGGLTSTEVALLLVEIETDAVDSALPRVIFELLLWRILRPSLEASSLSAILGVVLFHQCISAWVVENVEVLVSALPSSLVHVVEFSYCGSASAVYLRSFRAKDELARPFRSVIHMAFWFSVDYVILDSGVAIL